MTLSVPLSSAWPSFRSLVCALFVALSLYALLHGAAGRLGQEVLPVEDFAADMLLVNQLHDEGYLLTGHYSRYGFNHPGPVFLYANALFEQVGAVFHLPRSSSWLLCALTFNFGFLLLASWCIARLFGQCLSATAVTVVLPIAILIGGNLVSAWMPYRLILPFAVFYLSILLVLCKGLRYLPLAMLMACVLNHGYISMPIATLPLLAVVTLVVLRRDGVQHDWSLRWLAVSLIIGALFFLPILLDVLLHADSNPLRVLRAQQALNGMETAKLAESLSYTLSFWNLAGALVVPATLFWLASNSNATSQRHQVLGHAALVAIVMSATFTLYHLKVPKPLYPFMGLYYLAIPATLGCLLIQAGLLSIAQRTLRRALTLCLGAAGAIWLASHPAPPLERNGEIGEIGGFLVSRYGHQVALDYSAQDEALWASTAGLLVYLKDHGVDACVARPEMDYLFSRKGVCAPGAVADVQLVKATACVADCLFTTATLALDRPPFSAEQRRIDYPACNLPRLDSSSVSADCEVTSSRSGLVTFGPYVQLPPGRYRIEIEFATSLARGTQAGQWDIAFDRGQGMLGKGELTGTDGTREVMSTEFTNDQRHEIEVRTYLYAQGSLTIHRVSLQRL
ncbi:hypothetical protein A6723_002020 [Pseudomonas sp. AU11447]|uniref:hypothetical protein n=1 Tax=unclassified Pseudomonas TaxID=196821 RepID=UPI000806F151|nr:MULTISPECIES: hypothetical protein [unclassified Pseudomonas]OBY87995.1 hypothetical protein A6723_002020 [Pseudomonas sp. AU11447]